MNLKLTIRYTNGSSVNKTIEADDISEIEEEVNSLDFESLTLARIRHPADDNSFTLKEFLKTERTTA